MRAPSILLFLVLLAGCTSPQGTPAAETAPGGLASSSTGTADARAADPATASPSASPGPAGSPAPPSSPDDASHRHDLWEGKDRLVLLEGTYGLGDHGRPEALLHLDLPPGSVVPEGTSRVEMTFTAPARRVCTGWSIGEDGSTTPICTDLATGTRVEDPRGGPAGIKVLVRDAMRDAVDAGEVVWDEPLVHAVDDARQVDMPHARWSAWSFTVRADDPQETTLVFTVRIEAVRATGEVPLWPGHPDMFRGASSYEVLRQKVTDTYDGSPVQPLEGTLLGTPPEPLPFTKPTTLVTGTVRGLLVWANVTSFTSSIPGAEPTEWFLSVHNASGERVSTGPGAAWRVQVGADGMDPPYAESSRWGFRIYPGWTDPLFRVGCTGPCFAYTVEYELVVLAIDTPPGEPDAEA